MSAELAAAARAVAARPDEELRLAFGDVTSVSPFRLRLDTEETATAAAKNHSYTPTLADRVAVLVQGADRVVLFRIDP